MSKRSRRKGKRRGVSRKRAHWGGNRFAHDAHVGFDELAWVLVSKAAELSGLTVPALASRLTTSGAREIVSAALAGLPIPPIGPGNLPGKTPPVKPN